MFLRKIAFSYSLFDQDVNCLLGPAVADGQNESDKQDEEKKGAWLELSSKDVTIAGGVGRGIGEL